MEPSELLRFVVSALERLGLRYFVTGSTASIFFGEPRFTNDIDVVVDLQADDVAAFCAARAPSGQPPPPEPRAR